MIFLPFVVASVSAAPAVAACETKLGDLGTVCVEVRLAKKETPAELDDKCRKKGGTPKQSCASKSAARCVMGDTTLHYNLSPNKTGDEAAGFLHGGQVSCYANGGSFEPKPKTTKKPNTTLSLASIKAS